MSLEEPSSGVLISVGPLQVAVLHRPVDDRPVDALGPQLLAQCSLATRPRPIPRLDPRSGERLIVEHPELGEPRDRALDQIRPIAGAVQPRPYLDGRPLPRLEEPQRRLEDDRRVADLAALFADPCELVRPSSTPRQNEYLAGGQAARAQGDGEHRSERTAVREGRRAAVNAARG